MKAYNYLIRCPLAGYPVINGNMMQIIIKPLDFYKIEYIIKSMKTLKGGESHGKGKVGRSNQGRI